MKRVLLFLVSAMTLVCSCIKTPTTAQISFALKLEGKGVLQEGVVINVSETASGSTFKATTNDLGVAEFTLGDGIYTATCTWRTVEGDSQSIYNGLKTNVVVTAGKNEVVDLDVEKSVASQIIIKELYNAGCEIDENKSFSDDAYVILYNNSDTPADASNICFAIVDPANSGVTNKYREGDSFVFDAEKWLPSGYSVWWFECDVTIPAYSQILIAIKGCTDNTATVPASVDLSGADYYMYRPLVYNKASSYPAPPASMPETHLLNTFKYGMGVAWPLSNTSPAFYIFKMSNANSFSSNPDNYDTRVNPKLPVLKVPYSTVVDAVEIYNYTTADKNNKRFPSSIDAGFVNLTPKKGHTAYRNVDKSATEALAENEGKLVYNYAGGTTADEGGSTDPSGIDAEASIANGAKIIYMDTNNSSNDFHERKVASIKK